NVFEVLFISEISLKYGSMSNRVFRGKSGKPVENTGCQHNDTWGVPCVTYSEKQRGNIRILPNKTALSNLS
ncbi:MAG TPA: hypothetical protein VEC37_19745, partial [Bacillota bacterium]|nr:hypothetical protein [Bacillota bacterium]